MIEFFYMIIRNGSYVIRSEEPHHSHIIPTDRVIGWGFLVTLRFARNDGASAVLVGDSSLRSE
jgi:hypothetical protein